MPAPSPLPFLNVCLPLDERLADLLARLSVDEMLHGGAQKCFGDFTLPSPWFG